MYNTNNPHQKDLPSTEQLLRSTIIAILVALFILLAFVLPAEYGIDPTGIGDTLGLKEMGRIKVSLQKEIDEANKAIEDETWIDVESILNTTGDEMQATIEIDDTQAIIETGNVLLPQVKTDTIVTTIEADAAVEIKATMEQGKSIQFQRSVDQGNLNYNSHGESLAGQEAQYGDGRAMESNTGELVAQFDGNHGRFFRNRSGLPVTVTITITGDYSEFKKL